MGIKANTVTTANDIWGKVMFLHLSVILLMGGGLASQNVSQVT